jgi:Lipase maturation factor
MSFCVTRSPLSGAHLSLLRFSTRLGVYTNSLSLCVVRRVECFPVVERAGMTTTASFMLSMRQRLILLFSWTTLVLLSHAPAVCAFTPRSLPLSVGGLGPVAEAARQPRRRPAEKPMSPILSNRYERISYLAATAPLASGLSTSGTLLVRVVFVRALAFVYALFFAIALSQNKALIGDEGITPAKRVLDQAQAMGTFKRHQRRLQHEKLQSARRDNEANSTVVSRRLRGWWRRMGRDLGSVRIKETLEYVREVLWDRSDRADRPVTTLLWLAHDRSNSMNLWLDQLAVNGLALSVAVFVKGALNVPIAIALWILLKSIQAVGGPWYGYGWEPQLAELGFHALWCVPLLSLNPLHPTPIPAAVQWCLRWYLFRVRIERVFVVCVRLRLF